MTSTRPAEILRHLEPPGSDDRALVNRFAGQNDQAAFAELVRRHGPLVWAACLRVAGHRQDAEDAFQAVFLVLVRKCAAIRDLDLLGNWLYGVAVRVAMKARRSAARRRAREVQVQAMPDPPSPAVEAAGDLGPVVDEELAALPAWYHDAVVLCDLRGVSREEAARLLGIPEGTLSSRLANGRKKLAARLGKRGVGLSGAAIPGALAGAARATVPSELVVWACAVAKGTPIPAPVTRLASGDVTMTTKWLLGVAGAALVAVGAVFATQPDSPKPTDSPKPAPVVQGDPGAQNPEAKGAGKVVYGAPRIHLASDFTIADVSSVAWSLDGKLVAVEGYVKAMSGGEHVVQVIGAVPMSPPQTQFPIGQFVGQPVRLVGFGPGDSDLITEERERSLISGRHELQYWHREAIDPKVGGAGYKVVRRVPLDAGDTHGYAFAADGKTFRTLAFTTAATGGIRKITVTSVDAATGKTLKTLMTAAGDFDGYGLSPRGERLAVVTNAGDVNVFDVDSDKKLWNEEKQIVPPEGLPRGRMQLAAAFSPDGKRLVVSGSRMHPMVFDAEKGEALPKLENLEEAESFAAPACFSRDGRLLVLHGQQWIATRTKGGGFGNPREQVSWATGPPFLCVWDTETGKLLKQWNQSPTAVAFHPTKPVLAIVEGNGENKSRLGLWDFAAEVEKK